MYFLHQIKHTKNAYDKGIVVKDTFEAASRATMLILEPMPTVKTLTQTLCPA